MYRPSGSLRTGQKTHILRPRTANSQFISIWHQVLGILDVKTRVHLLPGVVISDSRVVSIKILRNFRPIGSPTCAYTAMRRLFREDPQPGTTPLFRSAASTSFTKGHVISHLHRRMAQLSFSVHKITGHSFRYGAAQHAKDCGLTDEQIQRLGRWTSDAFKVYVGTSFSEVFELNYKFQSGQCLGLGYVKNVDSGSIQPLQTPRHD